MRSISSIALHLRGCKASAYVGDMGYSLAFSGENAVIFAWPSVGSTCGPAHANFMMFDAYFAENHSCVNDLLFQHIPKGIARPEEQTCVRAWKIFVILLYIHCTVLYPKTICPQLSAKTCGSHEKL